MNVLVRPRLAPPVGACHQYLFLTDSQRVIQLQAVALFRAGHALEIGKPHAFVVFRGHSERDTAFRQHVDEGDVHGRPVVQLVHAQPAFLAVVHIGVKPLHHLAHQTLGAELEDFIGDIHLVDIVVETVEPCRGGLVRRILDDDRGGTEEDQRRLGVVIPRHAPEYQNGKQEPLPFGEQVNEQVHQVDVLLVLMG